jgi:hypothetical protein
MSAPNDRRDAALSRRPRTRQSAWRTGECRCDRERWRWSPTKGHDGTGVFGCTLYKTGWPEDTRGGRADRDVIAGMDAYQVLTSPGALTELRTDFRGGSKQITVGTPLQSLCIHFPANSAVRGCEVTQVHRGVRMVGAERRLGDRQRLLLQC